MLLACVKYWDLIIFLMCKNIYKTPIILCLNSIRIDRCFVWMIHTYNIMLLYYLFNVLKHLSFHDMIIKNRRLGYDF